MNLSRVFKASWWDRNLIVAGIGMGVVFWFVESLLHVYILRDGEFIPQVFYPDLPADNSTC